MRKFEIIGAVKAYGIALLTRHGILAELKEMLAFAELAHTMAVAKYVGGIFYDSNSGVAEVEFIIEPEPGDPVHRAVENVARRTLSQFDLGGGHVQHGGRLRSRHRAGAPIPQRWIQWSRR